MGPIPESREMFPGNGRPLHEVERMHSSCRRSAIAHDPDETEQSHRTDYNAEKSHRWRDRAGAECLPRVTIVRT